MLLRLHISSADGALFSLAGLKTVVAALPTTSKVSASLCLKLAPKLITVIADVSILDAFS